MTQAELDTASDSDANRRIDNDKFMRLLFEINFDQENRLRTMNSQPTITRVQYRNALLNTYRGL